MPPGKGKLVSADGKPWSTENQPKNRRKPVKYLTELLTKQMAVKKDVTITGEDILTGKQVTVKVPMPTREVIIQALLRQAAKGNLLAIKEVFDRTEGKATQPIEMDEPVVIHVSRG